MHPRRQNVFPVLALVTLVGPLSLGLVACKSDEAAQKTDASTPSSAEAEPDGKHSRKDATDAGNAVSTSAPSTNASEPGESEPGEIEQGETETKTVPLRDPTTFIFNRVLVKFSDAVAPKGPDAMSDAAWIALVENHTGAKVESVHRGPIATGVVIFAPLSPPRDATVQAKLAKTLGALSEFKYAEPDRLRGPR